MLSHRGMFEHQNISKEKKRDFFRKFMKGIKVGKKNQKDLMLVYL
jgi:hypothetical protein